MPFETGGCASSCSALLSLGRNGGGGTIPKLCMCTYAATQGAELRVLRVERMWAEQRHSSWGRGRFLTRTRMGVIFGGVFTPVSWAA